MTTCIALLRGINVGGNKKVVMADLRALLTRLGLAQVQTLLQSGNAVFMAPKQSTSELESRLEAELRRRLKLEITVCVRTAQEWASIVARNPFLEQARDDPGHLQVMCLKDAPGAAKAKALKAAIVGRELVEVHGREAYLVYPDGAGRSRLTNALIEKQLGTQGTARNWNTALKLAALTAA